MKQLFLLTYQENQVTNFQDDRVPVVARFLEQSQKLAVLAIEHQQRRATQHQHSSHQTAVACNHCPSLETSRVGFPFITGLKPHCLGIFQG